MLIKAKALQYKAQDIPNALELVYYLEGILEKLRQDAWDDFL